MESSDNISDVKRALMELSKAVDSPVLVVCSDIDFECFVNVCNWLSEIEPRHKLALLLESSGGSIEYAFLISKAVRRYCENLDVLISGDTKSAATLIALAADRILMGPWGELGPLDPQMRNPSGGPRRSPLETMKGLEFLRDHYLETFDVIVRFLLERSGMDIAHALEQAPSLLSPIAAPLYQLVDYRQLGDAVRNLEIGEAYALEVMRRWSPIAENTAYRVVRQLVWEYPDHSYIVDLEEAQGIGLENAEEMGLDVERRCSGVIELVERPCIMSATYETGERLSTGKGNDWCNEEAENS